MGRLLWVLAVIVVTVTTQSSSSLAEWSEKYKPFLRNSKLPDHVFLYGGIDQRTAFLFDSFVQEFPNTNTIILSSPGGSVYSALAIGREIDRRKMTTIIAKDAICYSACAFIYLAGHNRISEGKLGVHQISSDNPDLKEGQLAISDILKVLTDYGVPNELAVSMLRTPPDDMYVLDKQQLTKLGLTGYRDARKGKIAKETQKSQTQKKPEPSKETLASGTYASGSLSVVVDGKSVGVTVTEDGCVGTFDAVIATHRNQINFVGENCTISVTKLGAFDFSMKQGEGCSDYHGASCSFSGYVRRAK